MPPSSKSEIGVQPQASRLPQRPQVGLALGFLAVVFWSFGASLVYLGAEGAGTWSFIALSSLIGGTLQLIARRASQGELRTAVFLPWRLWVGPVLCFVLYGLVWPLALVNSSREQVFGVSLVNYLWPILTVVFSVLWVPGVRLTVRTVLALGLALLGLILANFKELNGILSPPAHGDTLAIRNLLPYVLALLAAITWAVYSSLLARWRSWAKEYVTSPIGFLIIGLVAGAMVTITQRFPAHLPKSAISLTFLYGAGPLAAGYLLWEMALPRTRVQTLSVLAAATPVLSTALLCAFLRRMPGVELGGAALLVSTGVVLSMRE